MQFQFTKKQIIFLIIAGVLAFLVIVVLVMGNRASKAETVELQVWGVDDERIWRTTIEGFSAVHPAVKVTYRQIEERSYESDLINALAAGSGPDVFMFDNNWLLKHEGKIVPVPQEKFLLSTLQSFFPQVVEQDFVLDGQIYALPLYIDTLVLAYDRDFFDQVGVAIPPETWEQFDADILALRQLNGKNLDKPAFAIGGSSSNISNAPDIANLFLMQSGSAMIDEKLQNALFYNKAGRNAFVQYMAYSNPNLATYTWNKSLQSDIELFAKKGVAGIFVYGKQLGDLRSKNALLNVGVGTMPQINAATAVNFPNYFGLAVAVDPRSQSAISTERAQAKKEQDASWDFVIFATTNTANADAYLQSINLPPALKFLITLDSKGRTYADFVKFSQEKRVESLKEEEKKVEFLKELDGRPNDPGKDGILARQALTARDWLQPDTHSVRSAFDEAIDAVTDGSLNTQQALDKLSTQIKNLLRQQ